MTKPLILENYIQSSEQTTHINIIHMHLYECQKVIFILFFQINLSFSTLIKLFDTMTKCRCLSQKSKVVAPTLKLKWKGATILHGFPSLDLTLSVFIWRMYFCAKSHHPITGLAQVPSTPTRLGRTKIKSNC